MEGAADTTHEAVRAQARSIVAEIARVDTSELADAVSIGEELMMDSLMGMQIISSCERQLDIRIDERRVAEAETVGQFLDLVVGLCNGRSRGPA